MNPLKSFVAFSRNAAKLLCLSYQLEGRNQFGNVNWVAMRNNQPIIKVHKKINPKLIYPICLTMDYVFI